MLKILIQKDFMGNLKFSVFTYGHEINEQWIFGLPQKVKKREGELSSEPTFSVPDMSSGEFMLALKAAIREYEGSTPDFAQGELTATKYHLEDMRKLVFEETFPIQNIVCKE